MAFLKVLYDDGDTYEGEWSADGKRNGPGFLKLKSGATYNGQFQNGFFHGGGVLIFPDGSKYEGQFELGKFHGYGVYVDQDGMKFEGQFQEGSARGLGVITFPDGSHGQPSCEGRFQGNACVERRSPGEAPKLARQAAAMARQSFQQS